MELTCLPVHCLTVACRRHRVGPNVLHSPHLRAASLAVLPLQLINTLADAPFEGFHDLDRLGRDQLHHPVDVLAAGGGVVDVLSCLGTAAVGGEA